MTKRHYKLPVYAYVILLDNKIVYWKISFNNYSNIGELFNIWEIKRLKDYKMQKTIFICKNENEVDAAFNILSKRFFKTWKHSEKYNFINKAY